jgi:hypothetical protein
MMEVTGKKIIKNCNAIFSKNTKFWEKGFEILQNIEDRATLQNMSNVLGAQFNGNH